MELPQEIEAFYVIPAVRRELARRLVALGLTQRAAAQKLGVTEPAVSQYLSNKRGIALDYPAVVVARLEVATVAILNSTDERVIRKAVEDVCSVVRSERVMCTLHRKHASVKENCTSCYE